MPEGIVAPQLGELVFSATIAVGEVRDLGTTQYGQRRVTDLSAGSAEGELQASFLEGGLDFELTLSNGSIELEQVHMLRAEDGSLIYLRTCGVASAGASSVRIVPDFEVANSSSLSWLNDGEFVGTRSFNADETELTLEVYDVAGVSPGADTVTLMDPEGDRDQPWECSTLTGSRGSEIFTEEVAISGSLSVGESKRGTRNVIPITGGSVSGMLTGSVVSAGADYQLLGGAAVLDARYLLALDDGQTVIVRNCGPFGALIPLFEASADGPYSFLNEGEFLSSDPGSSAVGVSITFYERN